MSLLEDAEKLKGRPFIVTQPRTNSSGRQENPIVFVDSWFLNFTGYSVHEMLGRNCNFLQNRPSCFIRPDSVTEEEETMLGEAAKRTVRSIATSGIPDVITVVNYTKDGKPFRNTFMIEVHKDKTEKTINFFVAKHLKVEYLFKESTEACVQSLLPVSTPSLRV